jgi:hypothetical protein
MGLEKRPLAPQGAGEIDMENRMYEVGKMYTFHNRGSGTDRSFYTGVVLAEDDINVKIRDKKHAEVVLPKAIYTGSKI